MEGWEIVSLSCEKLEGKEGIIIRVANSVTGEVVETLLFPETVASLVKTGAVQNFVER